MSAVLQADAAPAADADTPWDWPLARLVQHAQVHAARLGPDGVAALYGLWLARHDGPEAAVARFNLGTALQSAGRWEAAERAYRELLQAIELPQARYNLGLLLERRGRIDEALAQWARVAGPAADAALQQQALRARASVARRTGRREALREALCTSLALQPDQAAWQEELRTLDLQTAAAPGSDEGADPVIFVVAVCFNEAPILPFFLDHYVHFVGARKIILHDGGSTDGSAEIAARYPQVEFRVSPSDKLDDRELMQIRNEAWKPYRKECDWMIVCDVDEFLYHPDLHRVLREFKREGVTLPMVEGFNMISRAHPQHRPGRFLWQDRQTGWPDPRYLDKNLIFDPAIDINYTLGCHNCQPAGPVRRSTARVLKNLHMCMPSYTHVLAKSRRSEARLSDWNRQTNAGFHYRLNAALTRAQYNAKFLNAANVLAPRERPVLRCEALQRLQDWLAQRDDDPAVLELGLPGGGAGTDAGATAFLAWCVHSFGGRLLAVDSDARRRRHAQRELERAGLMSERVVMAGEDELREQLAQHPGIDLAYLSAGDQYGDAADLLAGQRHALLQFLDVEPRLAPDAFVVLDEPAGLPVGESRFSLLGALLAGRGWKAETSADMRLWQRRG